MSTIYEILPERLQDIFGRLPIEQVYELRLRANSPIVVVCAGRSFYLAQNGLAHTFVDAITVSKMDLETIVHKASDYSLYAVNDQLKQGFITIRGGVRIGICGEVVAEAGAVKTIKNIQSLNIRVPHAVRGCSYQILPYVFGERAPLNTLIISPPGCGKTTMLRDLSWQICDKYRLPNVLVIDERGEIAANFEGENQLDVGAFVDVISGAGKMYGFENGIRSMSPHVIITDEILAGADIEMVRTAVKSGVIVFASVHARGIDDIRNKNGFREIITDGIFDRYVVLENRDTAGSVVAVYDRNLRAMSL